MLIPLKPLNVNGHARVSGRGLSRRKLDRAQRIRIAADLMLMRKGQALERMHTKYGVKWFLANGQIADDVARRIVTRADVKPVDAGLFADCA